MIGLSNIRGNIQNKLKDISWSGNKPTVAIDLQCTILEKNTFYLIDSNFDRCDTSMYLMYTSFDDNI